MKLLVGLGNPGPKYEHNRHNVGFMAVDAIARAHGLGPWRRRFQGEAAEGRLGVEACLLLKPMTYMNESGRAVGEAVRFYKLRPQDVTVFHDELDLAPGKVRVKTGGGHAGHNGLRSIEAQIGPDFRRVRIGIGHPGAREQVSAYVLHDFAKADVIWRQALLEAIAEAAPELVAGNDARFMSKVAQAMQAGSAPAQQDQHAARPIGKPRAGARPKRRRKTPSQSELAREARAREAEQRPAPGKDEPAQPGGPLSAVARGEGAVASLLRRWLGRGQGS